MYYRYHTFDSMHQNKGKSIADCLADRTDYVQNPAKTNQGEYISSYECASKTVQGEFLLSKRIYSNITSREQAKDVIAYQIRQSFKPGKIISVLSVVAEIERENIIEQTRDIRIPCVKTKIIQPYNDFLDKAVRVTYLLASQLYIFVNFLFNFFIFVKI